MWDMSEGELAEYIAANLGQYEGEDDYQIGFCQNCNKELEIEQAKAGKLYCSEKCNQITGTVRYGRKALKDGRWHSPDVQEAIRRICDDEEIWDSIWREIAAETRKWARSWS